MKYLAFLFTITLLLCIPQGSYAQTTPPIVIGDSLTVGAQNAIQLSLPGATIDAQVNRTWDQGIAILRQLSPAPGQPIAFLLGANSLLTTQNVTTLTTLVPENPLILMVGYTTDPTLTSRINSNNSVIRAAAASNANISLVDWESIASSNPSFISGDGIHATNTGYSALGNLISSRIEAAQSDTPFIPDTSGSGAYQQFRTETRTIETTIGNPTTGTSNSDLVNAGIAIKLAYDTCSNGFTHDHAGLGTCLANELGQQGFSGSNLDAFIATRPSTIAGGCTQCLGYVRLAVTLAHGDGSGLTQNSAADTAALSSFSAGPTRYVRIGSNESLQPGDIGAKGGGFGHIVIVKDVVGNIKFTALESNANLDCRVTDTRQLNKDGYVFFRAQ